MADIAIKEPKRLQRRPHWRGLPIPMNVMVGKDGTPDFAAIDLEVGPRLGEQRKCALCGEKMHGNFTFIGGELSIESGAFQDGPMHKECARYSFFVCPYVSGSHRQYREAPKQHEGRTILQSPMTLARVMGLLVCDDYMMVGTAYLVAKEDVSLITWEDTIRGGADA